MRLSRRCMPLVLALGCGAATALAEGELATSADLAPRPNQASVESSDSSQLPRERNNEAAAALMRVAEGYHHGGGASPDLAKAVDAYRRAVELGSDRAMTILGQIALKGEAGAADAWEARRWFERAAEAGDPIAKRELGRMLRDGLCGPQLRAKGFEWLERAARDGDGPAQSEVGWMLWHGDGIEADVEEAAEWFRLAIENGDALGHAHLGRLYLDGLGVPKNAKLALEHLILAARELDNPNVGTDVVGVFMKSKPEERAELRAMIQACSEEPGFLAVRGCLPEICLRVWEDTLPDTADDTKARALLQRLMEAQRVQSSLVIAWHAYTAHHMAYDLALARAQVQAAAAQYPERSTRMRVIIESVAGENEAARNAARAKLYELADAGDAEAAFTLSERALTGIGEERNIHLARRYHGLVAAHRKESAGTPLDFEHWRKRGGEIADPAPQELAKMIAQAEQANAGRPDCAPVPVFRFPPTYPRELRKSAVEGAATIEFVVDREGRTRNVVVKQSTHPLFAAAAVSSLQRWRFTPGRRKGKSVNTRMLQPVSFRLTPEEQALSTESSPSL